MASKWIYIATLDQCTSEQLWFNPIVAAMSFDAEMDMEGDDDTDDGATQKRSTPPRRHTRLGTRKPEQYTDSVSKEESSDRPRSAESRRLVMPKRATTEEGDEATNHTLHSRTFPSANSHYKTQDSAPSHLSWLTQISRYPGQRGLYYDFPEFIWDDSVTRPPSLIYMIDNDFLISHEVCSNYTCRPVT